MDRFGERATASDIRTRVVTRNPNPVWEEEFLLDSAKGTNMSLIHSLVFEVRLGRCCIFAVIPCERVESLCPR